MPPSTNTSSHTSASTKPSSAATRTPRWQIVTAWALAAAIGVVGFAIIRDLTRPGPPLVAGQGSPNARPPGGDHMLPPAASDDTAGDPATALVTGFGMGDPSTGVLPAGAQSLASEPGGMPLPAIDGLVSLQRFANTTDGHQQDTSVWRLGRADAATITAIQTHYDQAAADRNWRALTPWRVDKMGSTYRLWQQAPPDAQRRTLMIRVSKKADTIHGLIWLRYAIH